MLASGKIPAIHKEKFVIIGAGNVATHLAKRLQKKEHEILQIVSRTEKSGKDLSLLLSVPFTTDLSKINANADVYLLCVPDDEILKITKTLKLPKKLVLHTSGSVEMSVLKNISSNTGVLYPLYSFSKQIKVSFSSAPFLVEASNPASLEKLKHIAHSIAKTVTEVNSTSRLKLHLAAVMVNNFTNHLYTQSYDYLKQEKINLFHLLQPLIKQTVKKIKTLPPASVQTGPAKRGDSVTLKKHLQLLEKYPEHQKVYKLFTTLIKGYYHERKF
jgi:predicted short-subunit dehydrogenase-like oxidoreductase (DUF2520 family)